MSVQSTNVRSSRPDIFSDTRPIFKRSIVEDVSGRERRRADAVGELARECAELFCERLTREVDVRAFLKNCGDDAQPLDAFRPHGIKIRRTIHRALDRSRDEHFNLLRGKPRRFRLNRDLRRDELGKHIERRARRDVARPTRAARARAR